MIIVAVGTTNSAKLAATRRAFARWRRDVDFVAFDVDSGVPAQPVSEQVFEGAATRAKVAWSRAIAGGLQPDYSVGMEAGTVRLGGRWCAWGAVCILDNNGNAGIGTTPAFELPAAVVTRLEAGHELGRVVEEISGDAAIRQGPGAVGLFTKGLLSREALFESGVCAALAPHVSPEWYFG